MANLIPNVQAFAEASGSGAYIFQIIDRKSKINVFDDRGIIPSKFVGDIEFKGVHFAYPARQEALVMIFLSFSCLFFLQLLHRFSMV